MKYIKSLAVAVAIPMAFSASASATAITSPTGTVATPTIHLVNEWGHVGLANPQANIECSSTIEAKVESHGYGVTAKGNVSSFSFSGCTNGWEVSVWVKGSLEIHHTEGFSYNGEVISEGMRLRATLNLGIFGHVTCDYKTLFTRIGTITGGNPATLHLNGALEIYGGSGICGKGEAKLQGSYVTTSALYID